MALLDTLRHARSVIRGMVGCFVLALGVSMAAPLVHAPSLTLVCSTSGHPTWVADPASDPADAALASKAHTLDCVWCLPVMVLPDLSAAPIPPTRVHGLATPSHHPHAFERFANAALARGPPAHA